MQAPQSALLLRIYTEEGKMNNHRPLYEDIVMRARAARRRRSAEGYEARRDA